MTDTTGKMIERSLLVMIRKDEKISKFNPLIHKVRDAIIAELYTVCCLKQDGSKAWFKRRTSHVLNLTLFGATLEHV